MGLLDFLLNENKSEKEKLFYEEAESLGLTKEQIEDCKKSGLSPEEWLAANEIEYYRELDK